VQIVASVQQTRANERNGTRSFNRVRRGLPGNAAAVSALNDPAVRKQLEKPWLADAAEGQAHAEALGGWLAANGKLD
jgi:hypothetical protein